MQDADSALHLTVPSPMHRSVIWHLLVSTLAVTLVVIAVVGTVTLVLVNSHFARQEETYLRERGTDLVGPLQSALSLGGNPADLQQIASYGLFTGHFRIRVFDTQERLLVDSGSFDDLVSSAPFFHQQSREDTLRFFVNDGSELQGFELPFVSDRLLPGFSDQFFGRPLAATQLPPFSPQRQPPINSVSDTWVRLPLRVDDKVVAYAELTEGPAFGGVIVDSIGKALVVGALAALVVAAVAGLFAAKQLTRPLQSLGAAADEMAAGNLAARASRSNLAEVDRLAQQFNSMAERLEETISSLEAEQSALRGLIADASHELRTPLTALKTFNELLAQEQATAEEPAATFVQESGRQINQLDLLTTNFLDLSRFEARLSGTEFMHSDVRSTVENAVQSVRPLTVAKGQTMVLSLPNSPIILHHDPAALERAISNLVGNAVKFTPKEGTIKVGVRGEGEMLKITVCDNGPGIGEDEQPHIFDRFYRGRGHNLEGSGLGLAMAKEISAIHGGVISYVREGVWSRFTIQLPLSRN